MVGTIGRSGVSDVGEGLGGDHGRYRIGIFGRQGLAAVVGPIFVRYGTRRSRDL